MLTVVTVRENYIFEAIADLTGMSHLSLPSKSTLAVSTTLPALAYLGYLALSRTRETEPRQQQQQPGNPGLQLGQQLQQRLERVQRSRLDPIEEEGVGFHWQH